MHWRWLAEGLAWMIALAWTGRAIEATLGMRRVQDLTRPEFDVEPEGEPQVVVIVPARDEAASVQACLRSLLAQDYGNLRIVAVNDRSTDATGALMDDLAAEPGSARMSVLHITELPEGWLGKPHALATGAEEAMVRHSPEYLLFTDADVFFAPDAVRRSLAEAVKTRADHFVTVPTPIMETKGEAVLLGFLQVMGLWGARPWKAADANARDAIGIGAFNLMRVEAYERIGGFAGLRMQILEDLTLAARVKCAGMRQRVAFAPGMMRFHWAAGVMGIVKVMTKNLFAIFAFQPVRLLMGCVGFAVLCLEPFLGLGFAGMRLPGVVALAGVVAMYVAVRRMGRIPAWTAVGFPLSAGLFCYSMLRSMVVTLRDGGVTWRGTFYPLKELRRNVQNFR
jgi:cellulose synthase/poly-beta-1,6-N-acetylglucosamine synthase-like glycosyltransferase